MHLGATLFHLPGDLYQPLGGIAVAVEKYILYRRAQILRNVIIGRYRAGIDNSHIHPSRHSVVEKYRVNGGAHIIVASEREREIAESAAHLGVRQIGLNPRQSVEEINSVAVVLGNAGSHSEYIGVENYIGSREMHFFYKKRIGTGADVDFALESNRLSLLVKCHHHHGGTHVADISRLAAKFSLAILQTYGIDNRFALHGFECGCYHVPVAGVYHKRHACDVGVGGDKSQEIAHFGNRVEHRVIHIDVDYLRSVLHLSARYCRSLLVLFFVD